MTKIEYRTDWICRINWWRDGETYCGIHNNDITLFRPIIQADVLDDLCEIPEECDWIQIWKYARPAKDRIKVVYRQSTTDFCFEDKWVRSLPPFGRRCAWQIWGIRPNRPAYLEVVLDENYCISSDRVA